MISAIIGLILLIGGITLYRTFALYEEKKEFNVLRGRVPAFSKGNGDIELAVLINGETSTEFPSKNSDAIVESIVCDNEATGSWNYQTWSINIGNLSKSKTSCTISFKTDMIAKLKSIIGSTSDANTVDMILTNGDDMNKIVASKEAMEFIIDNPVLKDAIKDSSNYTTTIAKQFLNSKVVSEDAKYNVGLPCYLYASYSKTITGGYLAKTNGSSSSYGKDMGSYYSISATGKNINVTAVSNNLIKTSNYNYLEMSYDHGGTAGKNTTTLGFSTDQNINTFTISKSNSTNWSNQTLTLNIKDYNQNSYLKINMNYQDSNQAMSNIYTIALY